MFVNINPQIQRTKEDDDNVLVPGKAREEHLLRAFLRHVQSLGLHNGEPGCLVHSDQDGTERNDALSFEGEMLFAFESIHAHIQELEEASKGPC
jgi:hypothetical protein